MASAENYDCYYFPFFPQSPPHHNPIPPKGVPRHSPPSPPKVKPPHHSPSPPAVPPPNHPLTPPHHSPSPPAVPQPSHPLTPPHHSPSPPAVQTPNHPLTPPHNFPSPPKVAPPFHPIIASPPPPSLPAPAMPPPHSFHPPPPKAKPPAHSRPPPPTAMPSTHHFLPPSPPSPIQGHHSTVIVVVFVSLAGLFFLAFLSVALCCFITKKKKVQKSQHLNIEEQMKVQEAIIPGPHGEEVLVISIEEDLHIQGEVDKKSVPEGFYKQFAQGSPQAFHSKASTSESNHHRQEYKA